MLGIAHIALKQIHHKDVTSCTQTNATIRLNHHFQQAPIIDIDRTTEEQQRTDNYEVKQDIAPLKLNIQAKIANQPRNSI